MPEDAYSGPPRLGLCMIVKNESKVIRRALESAKPYIDTWVISDTGSTDDTISIIKETMAGVPGEVFERPWVNFGANRTEAFELCRGRMEWAIVIDADDSLVFKSKPPVALWQKSPYDGFRIEICHGTLRHYRPHVFRIRKDASLWCYRGTLHEYAELASGKPANLGETRCVSLIARTEGARSQDPRKYENDAAFLERELARAPGEPRTQFYLAQSYLHAGKLAQARENYERRLALDGGYVEEKYICHVELTKLYNHDAERQIQHALRSIEQEPTRLEGAFQLLRARRQRHAAFDTRTYAIGLLASVLADVPREVPTNKLFVLPDVYKLEFDDEFAISALLSGHADEGLVAARRALAAAPPDHPMYPRLLSNVHFAESDASKMIEADAAEDAEAAIEAARR